jgi:hypothetical protein
MAHTRLHDLARMGAEARLDALDHEREAILTIFPDLRDGAPQQGAPRARKGGMSAEARKAQAERMRAYWAERRATKAAGAARASDKGTTKTSSQKAAKRHGGGMSPEARKRQAERMKAYWAAKRAAKGPSGNEAQTEATGATSGSASPKTSGRKAGRKQRDGSSRRKSGRPGCRHFAGTTKARRPRYRSVPALFAQAIAQGRLRVRHQGT